MRSYRKLAQRVINFEPRDWADVTADPRWHVDQMVVPLGTEKPGAPQADGLYDVAQRLLQTYEVADPAMVRAVYDPQARLDGRDMLLVGRLWFFRFPMGVRVGGVHDGLDVIDGAQVQRFGWHYRTLEGHLERGQMNYAVVKYLDDGRVEFRMSAYSQRGRILNPVMLIGFLLFVRWLQLRFYERAVQRMLTFTAARTEHT